MSLYPYAIAGRHRGYTVLYLPYFTETQGFDRTPPPEGVVGHAPTEALAERMIAFLLPVPRHARKLPDGFYRHHFAIPSAPSAP